MDRKTEMALEFPMIEIEHCTDSLKMIISSLFQDYYWPPCSAPTLTKGETDEQKFHTAAWIHDYPDIMRWIHILLDYADRLQESVVELSSIIDGTAPEADTKTQPEPV